MIILIVCALLIAGFAAVRQARQSRTPEPVEPALKFDDAQYRTTDPKQIAWQETQSIETGFNQPRGITLSADGKQLYVAGDQQVRAFRADGCREKAFAVGSDAYCIAVAPDGRLVVGMKDHIEIWNANGQRAAQWETLGPKAHLTSVTARGDAVWAGDAGNRVVLQFDATGKITGRFGERSSSGDQRGLVMPSPHLDVALDAQGTVWLNNPGRHRLEAYVENGDLMRTWGTPTPEIKGFCGCCNPTDFAFLPDGRFVTSEKGIPRVKVSAADGTFQNVVAGAESFTGDNISLDLAVAPDGRIFVLDPVRKSVRVFAPKTTDKPQPSQKTTEEAKP
jgi:DNA-binding beta-propeller fold protein YncE